jgi:hypothetical protein
MKVAPLTLDQAENGGLLSTYTALMVYGLGWISMYRMTREFLSPISLGNFSQGRQWQEQADSIPKDDERSVVLQSKDGIHQLLTELLADATPVFS